MARALRMSRFTRDWRRVRCLDPEADVEMLEALEARDSTAVWEEARIAISYYEGWRIRFPIWSRFRRQRACLSGGTGERDGDAGPIVF